MSRINDCVGTLRNVNVVGGHASNHGGSRVAPERVLEETGQLALSVRNVVGLSCCRGCGKRSDNLAETEEALVDPYRFFETLANRSCSLCPFAAGKVHEVELG